MRSSLSLRAALVAAVLGLACNAQASSIVVSVSDSVAAASGSVSDSLSGSSNSSGGHQRVANGDYQIIQIAATPGRADRVRLTMRAADPKEQLVLDLPQTTFDQQRLASGDLVHAQNRVYGVEFARADDRQPFYLVLADEWYGELAARPVAL